MKILVTGATGFLGKNLLNEFANRKEKVRCFVRKISNTEHIDKNKFEIAYGDITNEKSLIEATENINTIIHLAALIKNSDYESYYKTNVIGAKNLIDACKKNKVKRVIVASSIATTRTYLDAYGKTKLLADKLFFESDLDFTILRPSLIYSEDSKALNQIAEILGTFPFIIPIVSDGEFTLNPVHVKDVVNAITVVINNKKTYRKVYDIAGKNDITFNEFVDIICKKFHIKRIKLHAPFGLCLSVASLAPRLKNKILNIVESTKADIRSAQQDFSYNPIDFREGMKVD